jgi:hypothetical protein
LNGITLDDDSDREDKKWKQRGEAEKKSK